MTVLMFPGQGCQKIGMDPELVKRFPLLFEEASSALNEDIVAIASNDLIHDTRYTQPVLFTYHHAAYQAWLDMNHDDVTMVMGHSLGEYNALLAAGVITFSEGIQLVVKRAALMADMNQGGMSAVLGLPIDVVSQGVDVCQKHGILDIANHNELTQIVVSGELNAIDHFHQWATDAGAKRVVPLKVSGAFHSRLMTEAAESFALFARHLLQGDRAMLVPVIANVTALPYDSIDLLSLLSRQIKSPVRWYESLLYVISEGRSSFHEINAGIPVLSKIARRMQRSN